MILFFSNLTASVATAAKTAVSTFQVRLRKLLPPSWFPSSAPTLTGTLTGSAYVYAAIYDLLKYAKAQTRMATTSDGFLDVAAYDFTGARLQRRAGEGDSGFRDRVVAEVLRIRNTRYGIGVSLMQLTGRIPQIFEPWNVNDTGALNQSLYLGGNGPFSGLGCLGSTAMNNVVFVVAYRPLAGSGFIASDADIYAAVNNVRAAGVTAWVSILN